ncbi:hypothetical protein ONB79_00485 [Candidatus Vidania fulgoroideae]|nr:hypothetical protein ONB79_00485 [Candidatus Vidania fulgoroideae]
MKKPKWIKKKVNPLNKKFIKAYKILKKKKIKTLCLSSNCPNFYNCFIKKKITVLIMGKNCSRNCIFCNLGGKVPFRINNNLEIYSIINILKTKLFKKITITSVTRNDIYDSGSFYFANLITKLSKKNKNIEILITDFGFFLENFLIMICRINFKNICFNIETVRRLYNKVKPGFKYENFFYFIKKIRKILKNILLKTGMMIGLGEKKNEILNIIFLLSFYINKIVIGQFLAHNTKNILNFEYIKIKYFKLYSILAKKCKFFYIKIFPFARSSI